MDECKEGIFLFQASIVFREKQNALRGTKEFRENRFDCAQRSTEVAARALELRQSNARPTVVGVDAEDLPECFSRTNLLSREGIHFAQGNARPDQTGVEP